jgi:Cdc6-like AAA superfamily ATPase
MATTDIDDILAKNFVPETEDDWRFLGGLLQELFRPTAPIDEDRLFSGRLRQIEDLLEVIYQPGAHAILYGERGVGKTSLANIIHQRIIGPSKSAKVMKIGCSPDDTFETLWSNVFFQYDWQGKPLAELIKSNPQPFTIYKIAESLADRSLVILDEFDRVQDGHTKTLMADTIKYLSDNPLRFTIIVVGVGNSIEQLFGSHPSIQRCCTQIPMPRMDLKELRAILSERLPKLRMEITTEALRHMVQFSQGLPGYMHLLGLLSGRAALADHTLIINRTHLQNAVDRALDKADESTRQGYYRAIQSTKPDNRYREVLLACAMANKNELGQFSASSVCAPYSKIRGMEMGIEHFARHLDAFCDPARGPVLIKSGKRKGFMYQFANPLLEPLIIMKGRKDSLIKNLDDISNVPEQLSLRSPDA